MSDARLQYVASTLSDVFGPSLSQSSILSTLASSPAVSSFFDDPHTTLLCASSSSSGALNLSNTVDAARILTPPKRAKADEESKEQVMGIDGQCEVHLLKRERAVLPSTRLSQHVLLLTTFDSPVYSLYLTLHNVYGPKLAHSSSSIPHAVQQHFLALEQQLHRTLITAPQPPSSRNSEEEATAIDSVDDEIVYWQAVASAESKTFIPFLSTLATHLSTLSSSPMSSTLALLEDVADGLNDLWTADDDPSTAYPQARMATLLQCVESVVARKVREEVGAKSWIEGRWLEVREWLTAAVGVIEGWQAMRVDLVRQSEWRARWKDDKAKKEGDVGEAEQLRERIDAVVNARALYEELVSLLPSASHAPSPANAFAPFVTFDLFHPSPFTQPLFTAALAQFHASLSALEAASTSTLKQRLTALSTQPTLLLNECRLYPTVLSRPSVVDALEGERRLVLQKMTEMVDAIKAEYDALKTNQPDSRLDGRELSPFLQRLGWAHQLRAKLTSVASIVTRVFPGKETERFGAQTRALGEKIGALAKQSFVQWSAAIVASLGDPASPLHLSTSGAALMELDLRNSGELLVHYAPQLVALLRDCRLVSELGYKVDSAIDKAVRVADKYYRYGLKLRQIANVYNGMSEQILPSQLGLLVMEAQAFEAVVKDGSAKGKGWDWQRLDECDKYVERLEAAAEELMNRNRKLRAVHFGLVSLGLQLIAIDGALYKNRDALMELVGRMRLAFAKEEKHNTAAAMAKWRTHWDHQLYKSLTLHYRALLYSFTEQSLDIPVEIVFQRRRLTFRPPLEEIRSNYYRHVKRLLDLPKSFTGFNDAAAALYASIPERNADGLAFIFSQCERLFAELSALLESYQQWGALGSVELDDYIEGRLLSVADWELNFKALKARRKDSERIPDSVRVGCFTVSLTAFRAWLDDLMHRFSDALLLSLRKSTQSSQQAVDAFLKDAMLRLSQLPSTMADMETAKRGHEDLLANRPAMLARVQEMAEKDALLRQMTSVVSLDLSAMRTRWDDFVTHSDAFDDYLVDQRDRLKDDVQRQCAEQAVKVDAFVSRWTALKPSTDTEGELTAAIAQRMVAEVDAWREEWAAMKVGIDQLTSHCQTFELPVPSFPQAAALDNELSTYAESWSFFTQYRSELEAMGAEQWVSFRVKLSTFDDLTNTWSKKLKLRGTRDKVQEYLQKEMRNNREIFPILRKVTGEFYEKEHWRILFGYLGLPSTTSPATLTFQHLLDKSAALMERNKDITALSARAQGEVTIREAVEELKVWGENAKFSLLEYDKHLSIIKDWKDLFTALSDQQALASSLKESPYYGLFEDTAKQIETKLVTLDAVLHTLNVIQRKWVYLFPIFSKGALPNEQARFKRIDSEFRTIMSDVRINPLIMALASVPHLSESVQSMNDQMDRCQRALNDFLEEKRSKFPRFYFIGDDDLLEILGQSANPAVIQSHLKKLFAGCHAVAFNEDSSAIVAVLSSEKERVELRTPVAVSEDVEGWLNALTANLEGTLQHMLVECCKQGGQLERYPSQILCLAEMIAFTNKVEAALRAGSAEAVAAGLQALLDGYQAQLSEYTSYDTHDDRLLELKLKSLVFDLIHNLDVLRQLLDAKAASVDHWMWIKQLRFYLSPKQLAVVRMCDAQFDYTYEYQGNYEKLVHTPLSDKCYLVLTQAMHLGYGGCPFGPTALPLTSTVVVRPPLRSSCSLVAAGCV